MGTIEHDTIIRVGAWQRASTPQGSDLGHDIAPVIDGITTIGHLRRLTDGDYQAILGSAGPTGDAVTVACTSEFAGLIAVARHHHQI